ncbi:hypothetical protein PUMCH_002461 [Australozyma saopauloensis]|uniref:Ubiquitin-like domain-containing protein n=1 Tax=Australozyma saopauloensis TaxID=291208 RepID=A0AAX4H9H9_9ASCO|nr:hypothetical protein PUMCH_002461 [[Candida] saopauloensis]
MSSTETQKLPKKKKKFVFDDDDFFVIKKAKKLKSADSQKDKAALILPIDSATTPHPQSPQPTIQLGSISPNDDLNTFYSADETMRAPISLEEQTLPELRQTRSLQSNSLRLSQIQTVALEGDEDSDLNEFFSHLSKEKLTDELKRHYNVRVVSKIHPTFEKEQTIHGNYTFENLINDMLNANRRSRAARSCWQDGALVWVEGRTELKRFAKPSTLRINPSKDGSITVITCLLIPTEHVLDFESIYPEFKDAEEGVAEVKLDTLVIDIEDESEDDVPVTQPLQETPTQANSDNYFVIALKGKDNKRVEVEVNSSTPINKLLLHYLSQKGIDPATVRNPRLVFDSEPLRLDQTVGDTELEEDFEVEVYI